MAISARKMGSFVTSRTYYSSPYSFLKPRVFFLVHDVILESTHLLSLLERFFPVGFTVDPADAYSTSFTSIPNESKAGDSAQFEVQVFDRYGNLRATQGDEGRFNIAIDGR